MSRTPKLSDDYMKRTEVAIERTFDAPASEVWHAWADPSLMAQWIWAGLGSEVWAEIDLRVGGAYRVYSKIEGGVHQGEGWSGMCGLFVEVEPARRLVYTLHWDANVFYNQGGLLTLDEVVSVTLTEKDGVTHMAFVHMGIPDDGMSAGPHKEGIEKSFELLAGLL
jgi:uncharacterized protein YndB with AHSA1/START domain